LSILLVDAKEHAAAAKPKLVSKISCVGPEDTPIGGNASAIEGGNQFLAAHGWKTKRQDRIVGHGGCGSIRLRGQDGFDTQSLNAASVLRDTRQRIPAMR
jgi:hypothetical protein